MFVAPELVRGTLGKGFELYRALENPLAKAMFMMFIVAEVHPFTDGDGRIARIMMNAELISVGLRRILHTHGLSRGLPPRAPCSLSRNGIAEPYVKMLDRAQRFSSKVDFSSYDAARGFLTRANAFEEPTDARLLDDIEPSRTYSPISGRLSPAAAKPIAHFPFPCEDGGPFAIGKQDEFLGSRGVS